MFYVLLSLTLSHKKSSLRSSVAQIADGNKQGAEPTGQPYHLAGLNITRFRPWSPIATGNHLDRAEKIPKVAQMTGTVDVFNPRSGISGTTSRRASACPNLHE